MNMPTQNKVSDVSGKRQQRRTGRRNDKFLSLWQDKTTETTTATEPNFSVVTTQKSSPKLNIMDQNSMTKPETLAKIYGYKGSFEKKIPNKDPKENLNGKIKNVRKKIPNKD